MKITAFLDADTSEPITISEEDLDQKIDLGPGAPDVGQYSLRELLDETIRGGLGDINVVSENAINIALHALHGVAATAEPGTGPYIWAVAALRELAYYDVDGIECTTDPHEPAGLIDQIAGDPGREAIDRIRNGTRLVGQEPMWFVEWPELPATMTPAGTVEV